MNPLVGTVPAVVQTMSSMTDHLQSHTHIRSSTSRVLILPVGAFIENQTYHVKLAQIIWVKETGGSIEDLLLEI